MTLGVSERIQQIIQHILLTSNQKNAWKLIEN